MGKAAKGTGTMKEYQRIHAAVAVAVLGWLTLVWAGPAVAAAPLSPAASQALRNPPEQMSPALTRELQGLWSERARAYLASVLRDPTDEFATDLWIDHLAGRPYLHFKASGANAGYGSNPQHSVAIVVFVGATRDEIAREFGDWFAPFDNGKEFIRPADMGAERAAITNVTGDGTESVYWQQGKAFVEVRSRQGVMELARLAHIEGVRSGIYEFPDKPKPPSADPEAGISPAPLAGSEGPAGPQPAANGPLAPVEAPAAPSAPGGAPLPVTAGPTLPATTLGAALHAALRRNEAQPVVALIGAGADLEARDDFGRTPLMTAAEAAGPDLVQKLIRAGANPNAVAEGRNRPLSEQGLTALMIAARLGRTDVVRVLLEAGAIALTANGEGKTPLAMAEESGSAEAALLLRTAMANASPGAGASRVVTLQTSLPEPIPGPTPAPTPPPAPPAPTPPAAPAPAAATPESGAPSTDAPGEVSAPTAEGGIASASVGEVRVWQARLEEAWRRLNVDLNEDVNASILRAVIVDWDGRVSAESTGVTGYEYWRAAVANLSPADTATAAAPSGALTDEAVVQALRDAASSLKRDFGAVEVPYRRKQS